MAHDPYARGVRVRQSADKVHDASRVRDPLSESRRARVPEDQIGDRLAVGLAVALAEPTDGYGEVAMLRGRVGECVDVPSRHETASAEVFGGRCVYVVEGYDQHRQWRATRVARTEPIDFFR